MTGITFNMMGVTIATINVSFNALAVSKVYVMNALLTAGRLIQ